MKLAPRPRVYGAGTGALVYDYIFSHVDVTTKQLIDALPDTDPRSIRKALDNLTQRRRITRKITPDGVVWLAAACPTPADESAPTAQRSIYLTAPPPRPSSWLAKLYDVISAHANEEASYKDIRALLPAMLAEGQAMPNTRKLRGYLASGVAHGYFERQGNMYRLAPHSSWEQARRTAKQRRGVAIAKEAVPKKTAVRRRLSDQKAPFDPVFRAVVIGVTSGVVVGALSFALWLSQA